MLQWIFIREFLILSVGILLIIFASLNMSISPPPQNIDDISTNYNKTYCVLVESVVSNNSSKQRRAMQNAYILVLLSLFSGIFLVAIGLYGVYRHAPVLRSLPKM